MTTNNWRGVFIKEWVRDDGLLNIGKYDQEEIMDFIETQIAQAREEMKRKCLEVIPEEETSISVDDVRTSISSL